ncbi:hypothetical protein [Caulobacter sp. DWR2-3-1b2]
MRLDHDDLEALAQLERFSRKTRPFLLIGLLAPARRGIGELTA